MISTLAALSFLALPFAVLQEPEKPKPSANPRGGASTAPQDAEPPKPAPGAAKQDPGAAKQDPGAAKQDPGAAKGNSAGGGNAAQNSNSSSPAGGAQRGGAAGGGSGVPPVQFDDRFFYLNFDENATSGEGLSLAAFVKICQEATGINFTYASDTAGTLEKTYVRMFGTKQIPRSDFYQFFQIMMIINDFVCSKVGPEHLSVVLIQSLQGNQRQQVRNQAVYVQPENLDRYADQPAVLINTVVDLPHTDVRTLSNSMRTMFTDANTQQIIPVGNSNSLIITGFGSNVAAIVRMLKFVDEISARDVTVSPEFEVIPLEFASAEELADTLTDLLEATRRAVQARGAQQAANGVSGAIQQGQAESKIMVDPRTNALLVMAMPDEMPKIKELVARLDVDIVKGEHTYHIYNLENVDAEEIQKTLDDFIKDASRVQPGAAAGRQGGAAGGQASQSSSQRNEIVVVADKATNSLLIAANRTRYDEILELIKQLDIRQAQVLIETALIELSGQDSFQLAVELGIADINSSGDGSFGVSNFGLSTYTDTNNDGIPDLKVPNIAQGITAGIIRGENFSVPILLSALETRRDTNVLNVPSVLVNNNKSAKVVSKDEQPTTQVTLGGGTGVGGGSQESFDEYVEAGITLEISPTISASKYLRLLISLEVSTFIGAVTGSIPPPRITRTLSTTVSVPDGDTMVIGGLITDNKGSSETSVPFFGDIPILGTLFKSRSTSGNKTTLYFFVTPHIMKDRDFADLAEYSFQRKLSAADTIGAERIRVIDPSFGRPTEGVDLRGFEIPLYRGPERGEVKSQNVGLDPGEVKALLDDKQNAGGQGPSPKQEN